MGTTVGSLSGARPGVVGSLGAASRRGGLLRGLGCVGGAVGALAVGRFVGSVPVPGPRTGWGVPRAATRMSRFARRAACSDFADSLRVNPRTFLGSFPVVMEWRRSRSFSAPKGRLMIARGTAPGPRRPVAAPASRAPSRVAPSGQNKGNPIARACGAPSPGGCDLGLMYPESLDC
jgi:hypothetical protein